LGVGSFARLVVRQAMEAEGARAAARRESSEGGSAAVIPGQVDLMAALEESLSPVPSRSSVAVGTVPRGAAPVPPSGAAPARPRVVRLDMVVARVLEPGSGPVTPVARARALAAIKAGRVDVQGVGVCKDASVNVSPGAVVVRP
jgi:hypothetical protein